MLLTNIIPLVMPKINWDTPRPLPALISDMSLGLFLAMSLMSLRFWILTDLAGPISLLLLAQLVLLSFVVVFVIFNLLGRDIDAAVMCSGYAGLTLGATPTAIANMTAVTQKFGASPKAFVVVPLVGAFFIGIANAVIIKFLFDVIG